MKTSVRIVPIRAGTGKTNLLMRERSADGPLFTSIPGGSAVRAEDPRTAVWVWWHRPVFQIVSPRRGANRRRFVEAPVSRWRRGCFCRRHEFSLTKGARKASEFTLIGLLYMIESWFFFTCLSIRKRFKIYPYKDSLLFLNLKINV